MRRRYCLGPCPKLKSPRYTGDFYFEIYPNGAALSYDYDREGNVNAIIQNTAAGEANTNTTLYTAGKVFRYDACGNILFDWKGLVFVYDETGVVGMKYVGSFTTYLF